MSGTLDLTSLFSSLVPKSTTSTLLSIITGNGQGNGTPSPNPVAALQQAEQNQTREIAVTAKQPSVQRDIALFTAAVNGAKSVKQLLADPNFQKVFLTANALGSQIGFTALLTKALMSDPSDKHSLANTLSTSTSGYLATVKAYNFFAKGLSVIQSSATIATLASAYAEITWRKSLDATTPGLSNALTFRANAATITSVDQILGDSVMRTVVTTALGLPQQIAFQPLLTQETAVSSRLDISQFKNPRFVDSFLAKYLLTAAANASASATTSGSSSIVQLSSQLKGLTV